MLAWFREVARRVDRTDRALTERIGGWPRSRVDDGLKVFTGAGNHSVLWLAIAALLASRRGVTRRAAVRGVLAIGGTSFIANAVCKPLLPRRRPAADALPNWRALPDPPTSSSFPSGHAASALAFCTAVGVERRAIGVVIAPLAATMAYSRVHTGVHWPSDVVAGAALGTGIALATRRWWPARPTQPARARPHADAAALPGGEAIVVVANQESGTGGLVGVAADSGGVLSDLLPAARTVSVNGEDLGASLDAAVDGQVRAVGVAGGDGSVAAAATVALRRGLPLAVFPTGTLNHFARDVGVDSPAGAAAALRSGNAVAVDLAVVTVDGKALRPLVNTASLGGYPDLVRLRERWQHRVGKWPAGAVALVRVLAEARPLSLVVDGRPVRAWLLFVGNGPYHPRGMAPAFRPALDTGLLDIRYIRADLPLSRTRFLLAALTGTLDRSPTYVQREAPALAVRVRGRPVALATDGEVSLQGNRFDFEVAESRLVVYRP